MLTFNKVAVNYFFYLRLSLRMQYVIGKICDLHFLVSFKVKRTMISRNSFLLPQENF